MVAYSAEPPVYRCTCGATGCPYACSIIWKPSPNTAYFAKPLPMTEIEKPLILPLWKQIQRAPIRPRK